VFAVAQARSGLQNGARQRFFGFGKSCQDLSGTCGVTCPVTPCATATARTSGFGRKIVVTNPLASHSGSG
jgi:hypothetical protein